MDVPLYTSPSTSAVFSDSDESAAKAPPPPRMGTCCPSCVGGYCCPYTADVKNMSMEQLKAEVIQLRTQVGQLSSAWQGVGSDEEDKVVTLQELNNPGEGALQGC